MAHRVYHWKHGWIPLDHMAALSKAKGSEHGARKYLASSHAAGHAHGSVVEGSYGGGTHVRGLQPVAGDHLPRDRRITAAFSPTSRRFALHDTRGAGTTTSIPEHLGEHLHSQGHTVTGIEPGKLVVRTKTGGTARFNADGSDMHTAEQATRDAKASEQAAKAQQLRAAAETKRAEADRIAGRVGVGDSAAGRLNARGLNQFHQNTDSSLKRYTEANNTAFILDHKAGLAEARAKEAARARLTAEDIKGATHVQDQHGWHEVVRVNAKSVTVKTPYSWTETIPHEKVVRVAKPKALTSTPIHEQNLTARSDSELASLLTETATNDDAQGMSAVLAELEQRDQAARVERETKQRRATAREAIRQARQDALSNQYNQLVDAGHDPEDAYTEVFGVDSVRQRKQSAISQLRAQGFKGAGFDALARDAYRNEMDRLYVAAENATRTHMVNNAGRNAGVSGRSLMVGPEARARKYASDELLTFWKQHGRLTYEDYSAGLLRGQVRQGTAAWI